MILLLAVFCLCSCATYRDIKVNSVNFEKLSAFGSPMEVTLAVEIDNPIGKVNLTAADGVLKFNGTDVVLLECEPFVLKPHSCEVYHLTLSFTLAPGVSLPRVLSLVQGADSDALTLDMNVSAKDFLGVTHRRNVKDISLWSAAE